MELLNQNMLLDQVFSMSEKCLFLEIRSSKISVKKITITIIQWGMVLKSINLNERFWLSFFFFFSPWTSVIWVKLYWPCGHVQHSRNHSSVLQELASICRDICDVRLCPARVLLSQWDLGVSWETFTCAVPTVWVKTHPLTKSIWRVVQGYVSLSLKVCFSISLDRFIFKNTILLVKPTLKRV